MKKLASVLGFVTIFITFTGMDAFAAWSFNIGGNGTTTIDISFISNAGESYQTDGFTFVFYYTGGSFTGGTNYLLPGMSDLGVIEPSSGTVWASQGNLTATPSTLSGNYLLLATLNFDAPSTANWATDDLSFAVDLEGVFWTGANLSTGGHLMESTIVPIPGVIWLLGPGLVVFAGYRKRNRKETSS